MRNSIYLSNHRTAGRVFTKKAEAQARASMEKLRAEMAGRELETRFMEGIESGEIDGDVIEIDQEGREVRVKGRIETIFDV